MKIISSPIDMQNKASALRERKTIGFVPTMGGFHEGHQSLIKKAKLENDICLVSIFLNPTQFDNSDDLKNYPSSPQKDIELLKDLKVDFLFMPTYQEIYPDNYAYKVIESNLSKTLCGKHRPGHFDGVLTVVLKLLMLTQPHRAYFGEKDYQQLKLVERMVKAFFIQTQIVPCPTVRNTNGLALSTRNQRLSETGLSKAQNFAQLLRSRLSIADLKSKITQENIQVDYLEDLDDRRCAAIQIDDVRLIDNVML